MGRAIAENMFGNDTAFWDFVYQAVVIGLGIAATMAVYLQVSSL